jgi:capsular polysaccharide transport system ATP-binding protein
MIEFINASKYYPTRFGRHYIFRDVSMTIPEKVNIAIIGANGAGKSTLMRLIAGVDIPSEGRIVRTGRISWPLGLTAGLQRMMTGKENARFVCRIHGVTGAENDDRIERIRELSGIGTFFDMPVKTYSSGMRARVSFAISMMFDFDYYLFDELGAVGDRGFRKLSKAILAEKRRNSNFIMASHNIAELLELCDAGILIKDGTLNYFADIRDALTEYGEDLEPPPDRRPARLRRKPLPLAGGAPAARKLKSTGGTDTP